MFDVAKEQTVWTNDKDALSFEWESMRVEQVRSAMQRDHGLARSRPTLHNKDSRKRGANDFVLLALNRCDDVTEATRASRFESREQGTLTANNLASFNFTDGHSQARQRCPEEFIFDTQQPTAASCEMTTTRQPHRLPAGCSVERFGDWRAPVDNDRILRRIADRNASDVEALHKVIRGFGFSIDTTETQRRIAQLELGQTVVNGFVDHLALKARLLGATSTNLDHGRQARCGLPRLFETRIGVIDVGLFGVEIGVWGHGFGLRSEGPSSNRWKSPAGLRRGFFTLAVPRQLTSGRRILPHEALSVAWPRDR